MKLACEGEKIAKMQNLSKFKPAAVLAAGRFLWAKTAFPEQVIPSPQALAGEEFSAALAVECLGVEGWS